MNEATNLSREAAHQASPCKLRNGYWGARVVGSIPRPGDLVRVTARSGKTWICEVSKVFWSGDTDDGPAAVCSTRRLPEAQQEAPRSTSRRTSRRRRKRPAERRSTRRVADLPRDAAEQTCDWRDAFPHMEGMDL